ncbi:MAG: 3-dehydroquinate synthase [Actinobacteria bacterium]|nr:3-dehydroquinate synthase [Actinomycetota bacterium]
MPRNIYLNSTEELIKYINEGIPNESLIILDSALEQFQFHNNFNVSHVYLEVSEETKNLETIEKIWDLMFSSNLNRSDEIVVIGGGVMLDLCSFAASTYKRGIAFTLVPSTLLAMVDASHGGKNGFNNAYGKNQIGTFNLPKSVVVCFELLNTLKDNDYKDGLIELVKHGFIGSKEIFNKLVSSENFKIDNDIIKKGIQIKEDIVKEDYLETGKRKYLNFGHTIGHLIEQDSKFTLSHGEAVAIGMIYELGLSKKHFGLPQEVIDLYVTYLEKLEYKKSYKFENSIDYLLGILKDDKKSKSDSVDIVLLSDISQPNLISISFDELIEVIQN